MENIFYFSRKLESEKKLFMMIWSITDLIGTFGPVRTLTQDQILSVVLFPQKFTSLKYTVVPTVGYSRLQSHLQSHYSKLLSNLQSHITIILQTNTVSYSHITVSYSATYSQITVPPTVILQLYYSRPQSYIELQSQLHKVTPYFQKFSDMIRLQDVKSRI